MPNMDNDPEEDRETELDEMDDDDDENEADEDDAEDDEPTSGARKPRAKARAKARPKKRAKAAPATSVGFDKKGKLEFNIGGVSSAKIAVVIAAGSTVLGTAWGGFQVYQQFLTMQKVTAAYVPPDLSGINSQISVMNERLTSVERLTKGNSEGLNYLTGSISSSVSGTRQTVDAVSSSVRSSDAQNMAMQRAVIEQLRQQDQEQQRRIKELEKQVDERIQKTLSNPLAKDN